QRRPKGLFERLHSLTDGRLAQSQGLRRRSEAAQLGSLRERLQVRKLQSFGHSRCPQMITLHGLAARLLAVNRSPRVFGGPNKPLDLDAVHPGEPAAAFERSAGDVPMRIESLVN